MSSDSFCSAAVSRLPKVIGPPLSAWLLAVPQKVMVMVVRRGAVDAGGVLSASCWRQRVMECYVGDDGDDSGIVEVAEGAEGKLNLKRGGVGR